MCGGGRGLAGTEEAFARSMNERARQLGMTDSHFANASGWPDPQHRMSMRDLGLLAEHLINDFPRLYKNFALTEYNYKNRVPSNANNRNPLLKLRGGDWKADGLKTGHTQEAGYGLVGSAVQGDRRIIFVITGLASDKARAEEAERIVNWAYRQFTMRTLLPKGEIVAQAPVWLGQHSRVGLTTAEGAGAAAGRRAGRRHRRGGVPGPDRGADRQGDKLGELLINIPGAGQSRLPLLAAEDVQRAGVVGRLQNAALRLGERAVQAVAN